MLKRNNKGFTMIEILGAVIIMGVLLMIAVPSVSKLMRGFREEYYVDLEKTLEASAKDFYSDNKIYRPEGLLKTSYTTIGSLINKKYVEKLVDYKGKSCSLDESYVIVIYKGNGKYEYKACITCGEDDYISDRDGTYCDPAWKNNDNIKYNFDEKEELYVYHNTSKEDVRKKLLENVSIVKYNKKGETLDRVVLEESSKEEILPVDINELDTSISLDSDNKREVTLHYVMENTTKELRTIIYKHKEPIVTMEDNKGKSYIDGWTNKLIISLSKNDEYFELSNTTIANFQYSFNGGIWKNVNCDMKTSDTCSISLNETINGTYKFRIITNEGKISDETEEYTVKVDADKPSINITPNGGEPIIKVGETTGDMLFSLSTSDTGGSGIKSRKYAINTSSTEEPTIFDNFFINDIDILETLEGDKYYVWAIVEDNAGNTSVEVWPSNVFQMKYEVKYNANGGSNAPNVTYKIHNTDLTLSSTEPTRTGYQFAGWSTSSSGSVEYAKGDTYTTNKSITLYAKWTAKDYTIKYDANGGRVTTTSATYGYNTSVTLPTPTRSGYKFTGWYTSSNGGTKINSPYKITSNITLYAHWLTIDCTPLSSSWGNTLAYAGIKITADGQNIKQLHYGKYNNGSVSWNTTTTNPFTYSNQLHYKYDIKVEDTYGNFMTPSYYCCSKYDNLKPYTPYIIDVEIDYNISSLDYSECLNLSRETTANQSCTVRIYKADKNIEGGISTSYSSYDQYSTSTSGSSGVAYRVFKFTAFSGATCIYDSRYTNTCSFKNRTMEITAYDYAGNASGTLAVHYVWG